MHEEGAASDGEEAAVGGDAKRMEDAVKQRGMRGRGA